MTRNTKDLLSLYFLYSHQITFEIHNLLNLSYSLSHYGGPVAQRLEQGTHNPLVLGSNPSGPTIFYFKYSPIWSHVEFFQNSRCEFQISDVNLHL